MRIPTSVLLLALSVATVANAQPSGPPLPPDIDAQSYSRLPLILKDSLDEEGKRIFEAINGKEGNTPRLGPPASSLYSPAAAEPYDRLNQLLRSKNVIGSQFFEISTLVPAREFNQQYEWTAHELGARRVGVAQEVIDVSTTARRRVCRRRKPLRSSSGAPCCAATARCPPSCSPRWWHCSASAAQSRSPWSWATMR